MLHRSTTLGPLAGALLAAALLPAPAQAADLDYGYGSAPPPIAESKVEFGSGWYIRGDLGVTHGLGVSAGDESYSSAAIGNTPVISGAQCSATSASPSCYYNNAYAYRQSVFNGPDSGAPSLVAAASQQLGYDASLGAGYQFTKWVRLDATVDFLKPVKSSYQGASLPCITGTAGIGQQPISENIVTTSCTPTLRASLQSFAALVNGYVDLGTWYRTTPYVGAGVGLSFGHAQSSSQYYQSNGVPYQISYSDALSGQSVYQNWDRSHGVMYYNVAFALMGGVAFDVYDHTKLDIGYRYLHLGNVLGTDLATHQVRAGLRYLVDN